MDTADSASNRKRARLELECRRMVHVVNETEMSKKFFEGKAAFLDIVSVQTCVKQQLRPNKDAPIVVNFYAPIRKDDPSTPAEYDYDSLGKDEELIRND